MMLAQEVVSHRYAKAFVRTFLSIIPYDFLEKGKQIHTFFRAHKEFVSYLSLSTLPNSLKRKMLDNVCMYWGVADLFKPLLDLLEEHKRLFLFPSIVFVIRSLYKEQKRIIEWSLTSYPSLSLEQQEAVKHYLEDKTAQKALIYYAVDKNLIMGMRAQGDYFLWDRSARRLLQLLSSPLLER